MMARRAALFLLALTSACAPAPGTSSTPGSGAPMPAAIIEPYLKIQAALAADSVENVRANAGDLATAAASLGSPAVKIDTSAAMLTSAGELDDARDRFGRVSDAVITYMDGLHLTLPEGVRVAVCPADQKRWLQAGALISNPYSGSSAPPCGDFR